MLDLNKELLYLTRKRIIPIENILHIIHLRTLHVIPQYFINAICIIMIWNHERMRVMKTNQFLEKYLLSIFRLY